MENLTENIPKEYPKRPGTSGILGQLYETKLLSLIYFRAVHDEQIEEFHLATNVDKIGSFDDICFRAKFKAIDKPLTVMIQAKHRENNKSVLTLSNKDLAEYFNSYLKIRLKFKPNNENVLFEGAFDETECLFVIYTTAKGYKDTMTYQGRFADQLCSLIGTGQPASTPSLEGYHEKVCQSVLEEEMTALARLLAKYIYGEINDRQMLMLDELVLIYHVILAQKVFDVSDDQCEGFRVARFKKDFFNIKEDHIQLLKDELCIQMFKKKSDLLSLEFKVPASFGNKDLTIKGDDRRIERKLNDLTSKIVRLIRVGESKSSNIIVIDESMGDGFLQLSGGIASAVGNLLVFDEVSNLMKFNDNYKALGNLARRLFDKLNSTESNLGNLYKYNFDVQVKIFPKLSFTMDKYTEETVNGFLNNLLFYTSQSNEKEVEKTLIYEIMNNQSDNVQHLDTTAEAIFLKYHDEVQKWRTTCRLGKGTFLEKEGSLFKKSVKHMVTQPFVSVIKQMHYLKYKNYTFSEENLITNLYSLPSGTVIVTENKTLTVVKLTNCVNNKHYIVLDLDYILSLNARDEKTLYRELVSTKEVKLVIIVFVEILVTTNFNKKIENISNSTLDKTVIIIADQNSADMAKICFSKNGNVIKDKSNKLTDLSEETQEIILQKTTIIFQGSEVGLGDILISNMKEDIGGDVLNKIMHGNQNFIGTAINPFQNQSWHFLRTMRYVELKPPENIDVVLRKHSNRLAFRGRKKVEKDDVIIDTFYDLHDDVVFIIGEPGMGKSSLLTYISYNTKQEWNSRCWILRINLLEYSKEFREWKVKKTDIDVLESLKFLCKVAHSQASSKTKNLNITLEESMGKMFLKDCTGDEWTVFELKIFLKFYNCRQLIILFDGFDEICPTYANEVLALIKECMKFPRNHKIWITSRTYDRLITFLEFQFDKFYKIEPLKDIEVDNYLIKYFNEKEILQNLNDQHLINIYEFIKFMSQAEVLKNYTKKSNFPLDLDMNVIKRKEIPFLVVFVSFLKYLKRELVSSPSFIKDALHELIPFNVDHNYDAIPLHLNITADYLYNQIKELDVKQNKWDLDTNIFLIYEHFIVSKLKIIRFQDKTQNDMSKPDNIAAYEREYADFKDKHKKMAAYAVFDKCLFGADESKQIEDMIYNIKEGEERTGIICGVVNDIPIFVHSTFAEYFAVEYICDLLKSKEDNKSLWEFVLNDLFFQCNINVLSTFDAKIKIGGAVPSLTDKNIIFDLLLKQAERTQNMYGEIKSSLCEAIRNDLKNIGYMLLSTMEGNLNENNIIDFIKIVKETNLFLLAVKMDFEDSIVAIVNHVKQVDESKLNLLFADFLNIENIGNLSVDELVHKLHKHVWTSMDIVPDWNNLTDLSGQIYFI